VTEILLTICLCFPGTTFFVGRAPNSSYQDFLKDEIYSNWLSTGGGGDYNGDGICNLEDYAIVTSDYDYYKAWITVNFGVTWGTL